MNIQVNLLPEARLHKLKNDSRKKFYGTLTGLIAAAFIAAIILFVMLQGFLLATYNLNKTKIADLNKSLDSSKDLEEKASTLQANLASFYQLNSNRTYASRVFTNLSKVTPSNITIDSLQIDNKNLVTISGTTDSYSDVSRFGESLAQYNVNYLPQPELDRKPIFKDIAIVSVTKDTTSGKVNFSITFNVDANLLKKQAKK
jgi:Tfp pilus assembly protein PilN